MVLRPYRDSLLLSRGSGRSRPLPADGVAGNRRAPFERFAGGDGQGVRAVVFDVRGVALHPDPLHVVMLHHLRQLLPEVHVLDVAFVRCAPTVGRHFFTQPLEKPLRTWVESVWRITVQGFFKARSAMIAPVSSIRLLVESGSPPVSSRVLPWLGEISSAAQPGFGEQAPSQ